MTSTEAEKAVVIARRRKRKALPGRKQESLVKLKMAVTLALACVPSAQTPKPQTSDAARAA